MADARMREWAQGLREWLLPTCCLLCGERGGETPNLCNDCARALPRASRVCPVCARLHEHATACAECRHRPPPYDRTIAALTYAPPADHLVTRLKFGGSLTAGAALGALLADVVDARLEQRPECLVPVPLHDRRLRQRGFNQAAEIARPVARRLGVAIRVDLCRRTRATAPQSSLGRARDRRRNLQGAFAVVPARDPPRGVAIVDDVMTTGATVDALAEALRRSGVQRVEVWVATRALEVD